MTFDDIRDDEDVLSSSWSGIIELFLVVVASILHAAFFTMTLLLLLRHTKRGGGADAGAGPGCLPSLLVL
jgi:hypothetical protein